MRLVSKLLTLASLALAGQTAAQGPAPLPAAAPTQARAATAPVQPAGARPLEAADVEAWLDGMMPYALARGQIAGAVVVVVRGNGVVLQKGYGYSDVAKRTPVLPDATLFRPGSVSKLFTWTAVMQQVEAGKLDLDRDVNAYLDFKIPPFEGKPITLRHIMTHTPGFEESIRHLISSDPKAVMPLNRQMKLTLPHRVFAPGTTPAYSNYATALAGYIVERVSGTPFDNYVEARIFRPLGMNRSTFRQPLPAQLVPLMSKGYALSTGKPQPFEIVIPAPAGSLSATGTDMAKFMIAHLNEGRGLLRPETARAMHTHRAPGIEPLNTMALGFYELKVNGRRAIAHGGDTGWFHSYLWLFPDADMGLYVSVNSDGKEGAPGALRSALFHGFADRYLPGSTPAGRVDEKTAREHAALVAGHYISSRGSFTNFMSLLGLLGQAQIVVGEDGKIQFPALDGISAGPRDWVEVAPFVWQDSATGEHLAAEVMDGRVVRMSVDPASPFMTFMPAPFGQNTAWLLPALLAALALVAIAAIAWPVRARVRRTFGATFPLTGRSLQAWRWSRIFSWLVLLAVAGWAGMIAAFSADIGSLGGPLDPLIIAVRILTPIATFGLLAASLWHLWLTIKDGRRWTMKVGAALLGLAALVLVWVTLAYHLYGFGMTY